MKKKFTFMMAACIMLLAMIGLPGKAVGQEVTWERVTSISTLTDGGTFIMGYEETAKSGVIIPLRSKDCNATTSANGYFNTGTTNNSSTSGTIDMSNLTGVTTSDYEVYITASSTTGYINIQRTNSSGNYYGATSGGTTSNKARLYTSGNSNETNLLPEWASETNNQFKLTANVSGSYKYLKYNTSSPRFAFYNSAGEKIVFYKKVSSGPTLSSLTYTGTPTINSYEAGDYFVSTGLTITAHYSDNTTANVTAAVTWTPSPLTQGTTSVRATYGGKYVDINDCITVNAATAANIVLTYNNTPFTSASGSNTNTETVTLDGIAYDNYGGYNYDGSTGDFLAINRAIQGYLGNNTELCGNIKKIVVNYNSGGASLFTMYEGASALSETTAITSYGAANGLGNMTYMFSRNNGYFKFKRTTTGSNYSDYSNIVSINIWLGDCANPAITVSTTSLTGFTYIEGNGPSAKQTFTVSGDYLSEDLNMSLGNNSDFEMCLTENGTYTNAIALTPTTGTVANTTVYVRLKADKTKGNYNGTITLTSQDATDKTISLSGSVTGQTYTLTDESGVNGSISFAPASPVEASTEVTLTPAPASDAYYFEPDSWTFFNDDYDDVTDDIEFVTGESNIIVMPAYNLHVDATFSAKPNHTVTCVYDDNLGAVEAEPASTYEGQTVTLTIVAEDGYYLSSITATYNDGSEHTLTLSGTGNSRTFTMPNYDVTVTATFLSNTYVGQFLVFSGDLTEGDYIIVYNNGAMTNSVNSSSKFTVTNVSESIDNGVITNPSKDIVWHIAPSATTGYWTIKNEKRNQYANQAGNASGSGETNVSFVNTPYDGAKWSHVANSSYDFRSKLNEGQTTVRYIRDNGNGFGTYASTNGGPLTLYKLTVLTPVTITFNGHGGATPNPGSVTTYTQEVYSGIEATLNANQFVRDGYGFTNWSTEEGGGGTTYADGANITINANTTLYAQWAQKYTATVSNSITGGTVKIIVDEEQLTSYQAIEGTEITLLATASAGYNFSAWNVKDADNATVTVTNNKFTMPAKNVTISATFEEVTSYQLVTNANQIVSGAHYYIASGNDGTVKAMGSQNNGHYRNVVQDITVSSSAIVENENIYEFVINGPDEDGFYTIFDVNYGNNGGYLYASSSSNNYMDTQATNDNNGKWSIDIANTGAATIEAQGTNTRYKMRFNNDRFSCYGENTSVSGLPYLYLKHNDTDLESYGETTLSGEVTCTDYTFSNDNGKLIIVGGGVFICTGTITGATTSNLIIEDGGQLITSSSVKATFKKTTTASTEAKTATTYWYAISSPIDEIAISSFATGTHNVYSYIEKSHYWNEYRGAENTTLGTAPFTKLANGRGYLYRSTASGIDFKGDVNVDDATYTLTYTPAAGTLAGFHLIGNPYTHNIYKGANAAINSEYLTEGLYTLNVNGGWEAGTDNTTAIAPGCAVLVQTTEAGEGQTLTITNTDHQGPQAKYANDQIMFTVENTEYSDNTYVLFKKGRGLNKIEHRNAEIPMLYVISEGENYAIADMPDNTDVINLGFEAKTMGQYTISLKAEGQYSYMHLVDKLTGKDTDMLVEDSYTFVGTPNDRNDRFVLRLNYNAAGIDTESDIFAYQSGNDIMVSGEGELQVFDITGRKVMTTNINGVETINGMNRGVYIFRLNEKIQKIVVR